MATVNNALYALADMAGLYHINGTTCTANYAHSHYGQSICIDPSISQWKVQIGGMQIGSMFREPIKFKRLWEDVVMYEGGVFEEPLDELRLSVSKWLRG